MSDPAFDPFLSGYSPAVQAMARRARELVLAVHPAAVEKVWPGWKVIGYGLGPKMGDVVVGVAPLKERLRIHFMRGTTLPDPQGLLEAGDARQARAVRFSHLDGLERPALRALLEAAFATHSAAETAAASTPDIVDETVRARTGRGWGEWCALLEAAGAAEMSHGAIVTHLAEMGLDSWWQQAVTVGYERLSGRRERHQTARGFAAGGSKTVGVPVERLFAAWTDETLRAAWLPDAPFAIRKATPPRSLRVTWGEGGALDVLFVGKGEGRSQVSVDQRRLPDSAAVEEARAFWRERLAALKQLLEGRPGPVRGSPGQRPRGPAPAP